LELYLADLSLAVGDHASSREDQMVEIRVAVTDAAEAHGLLQRLAALFGRSSVSLDGRRSEVRVRSEWESRSVVEVIDVVQSWLAADGVASAELSVGDRSYRMLGPAHGNTERTHGVIRARTATDRGPPGARPTLNWRHPWSP
jgi:hypothetical protein